MDPTERFTIRVQDYVRYRPTYPKAVVEALIQEGNLEDGDAVADVGAGTGIFSKLLLDAGLSVTAVEPNEAMRSAAEAELLGRPRYASVAATAEATGLPDRSQMLVTAAQAFHWFRVEEARRELLRILKPGQPVGLVWNERSVDTNEFLEEYETALRKFAVGYEEVLQRRRDDDEILSFFTPGTSQVRIFANKTQCFDSDGFLGRVMSSSYAPVEGDPMHEPFIRELRRLYDVYEPQGLVAFPYQTKLFTGRIDA